MAHGKELPKIPRVGTRSYGFWQKGIEPDVATCADRAATPDRTWKDREIWSWCTHTVWLKGRILRGRSIARNEGRSYAMITLENDYVRLTRSL